MSCSCYSMWFGIEGIATTDLNPAYAQHSLDWSLKLSTKVSSSSKRSLTVIIIGKVVALDGLEGAFKR